MTTRLSWLPSLCLGTWIMSAPPALADGAAALIFTGPARPYCSITGPGGEGIRNFAQGDFDGDGTAEVILGGPGRAGGGGLTLLPSGLNPLWEDEIFGPDVGGVFLSNAVSEGRLGQVTVPLPPEGDLGPRLLISAPKLPSEVSGSREVGGAFLYGGPPPGNGLISGSSLPLLQGDRSGERLGQSIGVGDLDGDGALDWVLGAPMADAGAGRAYVGRGRESLAFSGVQDPALSEEVLILRNPGEGVEFGRYVAIFPDLNGDGIDELGVSAYRDGAQPQGSMAAATYVYFGRSDWAEAPAPDLIFEEICPAENPNPCEDYYVRVGGAGDLNADGCQDLVITSANTRLDKLKTRGTAWLFYGTDDDGACGAGFNAVDAPISLLSPNLPPGLGWLRLDGPVGGEGKSWRYGVSIAALGPFLGGGDVLAIGASEMYGTGGKSGALFLFEADPELWGLAGAQVPIGEGEHLAREVIFGAPGEHLGLQARGEDVDADGHLDLVTAGDAYDWLEDDWLHVGAGRALIIYGGPLSALDGDGDGAFGAGRCLVEAHDCDDADPLAAPGLPESCALGTLGVDSDCDGDVDEGLDQDQDGFLGCDIEGGDCDDSDPEIHPGAEDHCGDGRDEDCDGHVDESDDRDGDGFSICATGELPEDCDDLDPEVSPGGEESCGGLNARDEDCDGQVDEGLDEDGDGSVLCDYPGAPGDCDDSDPARAPALPEIPYDGIDNDCDGQDATDVDGDGYLAMELGGEDCDDRDPTRFPGAREGEDVDIDGIIEGDGQDNDCDGLIDEDTGNFDDDGDCLCEEGPCEGSVSQTCPLLSVGDCDDTIPSVPLANVSQGEDLIDGLDGDCDGRVDEGYGDHDGDGFSPEPGPLEDCDDNDPSRFPGAPEVPNDGIDQDCQKGDAEDRDLDTFISEATGGEDCDDRDGSIHPLAEEIPWDGVDQDCDGAYLWDVDGDGACGRQAVEEGAPEPPSPPAGCPEDCDDADPYRHPGAPEAPGGSPGPGGAYGGEGDALDNDCDGIVDEGTLAYDDDGDCACEVSPCLDESRDPGCTALVGGDCDDGESAVYPGAREGGEDGTERDGLDQDCDGRIDEGVAGVDLDEDGATVPGDCDDDDRDRHPGASEDPEDGVDNDCDGVVDEGAATGCHSLPRGGDPLSLTLLLTLAWRRKNRRNI